MNSNLVSTVTNTYLDQFGRTWGEMDGRQVCLTTGYGLKNHTNTNSMTTTEHVKDIMKHRDECTLVDFGAGKNYLRLVKHTNGRIDLEDLNSGDTGEDVSMWTIPQLRSEVRCWLECVDCSDEDIVEAMLDLTRNLL